MAATFVEFISMIRSSKEQAITWHHQTDDYSVHKALQNYYEEILDIVDGLVESTSGIFGRPVGYEVFEMEDYVSADRVLQYFQQCYQYVQTERGNQYQESWVQNQIDEIAQLLAETCYLLTLK